VADPRQILEQATTVAVVGMSTDPEKAAHRIPMSLHEAGFKLYPVHPEADQIGGIDAHTYLTDLPEVPDVVEVFRPAEEAPDIAKLAAGIGAKALWLQKGVTSPEARSIAMNAGMDYVEDLCMGEERARHDITKL
jgi:predicted CoA-binding protein